jgi:hypothetical protein
VGYSETNNMEEGKFVMNHTVVQKEYIMMGTSRGEVYQLSMTKNNSLLMNTELIITLKNSVPAMSMAADAKTGTLMIGTDRDSFFLFKVMNSPTPIVLMSSFDRNYGPTIVTSIKMIRSNQKHKQSFYVCALANGMIKIFNTECKLIAELMGHSRSINALATPYYVLNENRSF